MTPFALSEEKALTFHRAVLGLLADHPNLVKRALAELAKLRARRPAQEALWDRWQAILDMPAEDRARVLLADTPDGGLLRANSPLAGALSATERNAVWQRIGLMQFMGYYLEAAADLGLDPAEQAAITGIDANELAAWQTDAPRELQKGVLDRLKQVVALHKALSGIAPDRDVRRRWLRAESETLAATPLSLMMEGKAAEVMDSLLGAAQLTMGPGDLPRMG